MSRLAPPETRRTSYFTLASLIAAIAVILPAAAAHAGCIALTPFSCPCDWMYDRVLVRGTITRTEPPAVYLRIEELLLPPPVDAAQILLTTTGSIGDEGPSAESSLAGIVPGAEIGGMFTSGQCDPGPESVPGSRAGHGGRVPLNTGPSWAVGDVVVAGYKRAPYDFVPYCTEYRSCAAPCAADPTGDECRQSCVRSTAAACTAHRQEALLSGNLIWVPGSESPSAGVSLDLGAEGTVALSAIGTRAACVAMFPIEQPPPQGPCMDSISASRPEQPGCHAIAGRGVSNRLGWGAGLVVLAWLWLRRRPRAGRVAQALRRRRVAAR